MVPTHTPTLFPDVVLVSFVHHHKFYQTVLYTQTCSTMYMYTWLLQQGIFQWEGKREDGTHSPCILSCLSSYQEQREWESPLRRTELEVTPKIGRALAYRTQAKVQAGTGSIDKPAIMRQTIGEKSGPRSGQKPKEQVRNGREHVSGQVRVV